MLGGVLPDVMKIWVGASQAKNERAFLELQSRLSLEAAKIQGDTRMRELDASVMVQEAQAFREHLTAIIEAQARPTGIRWIDGFNAVLRPACTTLIILLFMGTAVPFVYAVIHQFESGQVTAVQMAQIIWGSLVGEAILGVLGFLYGYRSTLKKA
jgi:hypothetical protein